MKRHWLAVGALLVTITAVIGGSALWLEGPWHAAKSKGPVQTRKPQSCELPIYLYPATTNSRNVAYFLTLPIGSLEELPDNTLATKPLDGRWSYDAHLKRWLPVDYRLISPDGNWWIYHTLVNNGPSTTVHLASRSGTDQVVWSADYAAPLGWTSRGAVFLHVANGTGEYWSVDPATRQLQRIPAPRGEFAGLDSTGIWGLEDRSIGTLSNDSPLRWILNRTDLNTGQTVTWWDENLTSLATVLTFEAGNRPVVLIYPTGGNKGRAFLLTAPKTEVQISESDLTGFDPFSGLGDGNVVWFGGLSGQVWRWTPAAGLELVAQVPDDVSGALVIAAPCR